jgi:HAE1 family hydrophobic/amphiphilic exporter-1
VAEVFSTVGTGEASVERANVNVKLTQKGPGISDRALAAARPALERAAAGAKLSTSINAAGGGGGGFGGSGIGSRPVVFNLQGNRFEDVEAGARQIVEALKSVPGATEPASNFEGGKTSLQVTVDRTRAADLGVSVQQVGNTVRTLVTGERAGAYHSADRDLDVMVRLQPGDRATPADLLRLPVQSSRGAYVPLGTVAQIVEATEPTVIERSDRQRQVVVGANVVGRDTALVQADARAAVANLQLPEGVSLKAGGQEAFLAEALTSLAIALLLAILFVYMILCAQFGSFVHPFTIMLALPFSAVGALLAIFLSGKALDTMVFIGLILLMGLVTKNSILLVDYTNQLKEQGRTTREALLEAGPIRLRPILMTTLAMIFGMIPVAAGLGTGAELRQSMGMAVIGGLLTSTLLTLVVVPVAYSLIDGLVTRIRRRRRPESAPPTTPAAASEAPRAPELVLAGTTTARSPQESRGD